jgi:hypothetical protein
MEYASHETRHTLWLEISEPNLDWEGWRDIALRGLEGFVAVVIALVVIVFVAI